MLIVFREAKGLGCQGQDSPRSHLEDTIRELQTLWAVLHPLDIKVLTLLMKATQVTHVHLSTGDRVKSEKAVLGYGYLQHPPTWGTSSSRPPGTNNPASSLRWTTLARHEAPPPPPHWGQWLPLVTNQS